MRVKTEDRRQAIIEAALAVFREYGFERASMALISRRLGGSKGTLYSYFESKEDLFETAMKAASEGPGDQIMDLLDASSGDVRATLKSFAKAYIRFILSEEVLAITRTAIADGFSSPLGAHLFEQGPGRALAKMTGYFSELMKQGQLRPTSPISAALHFKGLVEAGFLENALYGAPLQQAAEIGEAVEVFLEAYAKPA